MRALMLVMLVVLRTMITSPSACEMPRFRACPARKPRFSWRAYTIGSRDSNDRATSPVLSPDPSSHTTTRASGSPCVSRQRRSSASRTERLNVGMTTVAFMHIAICRHGCGPVS